MGTVDQLESTYKKRQKPQQNSVLQQTKPFWKQPFNQESDEPQSPLDKLPKHIDFIPFCRWTSYPKYSGTFWWQRNCEKTIKDAKYAEILVPRDHGKSIMLGNKTQHFIHYQNTDVLYLGWTDRRKEVAEEVCNFFETNKEMEEKKSSFHFTTKNGGKFDCYLIKSKDILGMHSKGDESRFENLTPQEIDELKMYYEEFTEDVLKEYLEKRNKERKLCIIIDDPIDDSFFKERHKEEELERRFMSTIYNINPDKWIFTGTKKFNGDFFDFIERTFKGMLVQYKRKTHLEEGQEGYNRDPINNPNNLLCPERFTEEGMPNYRVDLLSYEVDDKGKPIIKDGKKVSKTPKRDLTEIYNSLKNSGRLYWWFAEYEQEPHPITGEVWKSIATINMLESPYVNYYDMLWITIDRATTRKLEVAKKDPDYTGCVLGLREYDTGRRIIIDDWTGYIDIDELLLKVNCFIIEHHKKYEHMSIVIIVETQGGGSDFVTLAYNLPEFVSEDEEFFQELLDSRVIRDMATVDMKDDRKIFRISNKLREWCSIKEVHNTGEKESRIRDRLNAPIKNRELLYLNSLLHSEVITALLNFPHCEKFDAPDCVANMEFMILQEYPIVSRVSGGRIGELRKVYDDSQKSKAIIDDTRPRLPFNLRVNKDRKSVF